MHPNRQPRAPQCVDWSEQLGKVKPAARAIGLFRSTEIGHIKGMVHAGHHTQQAHGDADAGDGENGAAPVPPAVLEHQREIAEHNKEHYSSVECTTGLPACRRLRCAARPRLTTAQRETCEVGSYPVLNSRWAISLRDPPPKNRLGLSSLRGAIQADPAARSSASHRRHRGRRPSETHLAEPRRRRPQIANPQPSRG
jgi:hypothetical protein